MKKTAITIIKAGSVAILGTAATLFVAKEVGDRVFENTEDFGLSTSMTMIAGMAGLAATATATVAIVDHDTKTWSDEEFEDARRLGGVLGNISDGLGTISRAMRIASLLA